ncbi:MAG: F0F1 ATP synthase subunit epsilon [Chloroflexi bacterium]|nr:F0F1 ATP synthase subunit epsilon [Chloroflexota bacterium]
MPIQLDVVTLERSVYSADDVDMVVVPGSEGVMGILPNHAPVVTALKAGVLEIIRGENREQLAIGGGFVQITGKQVVVLADAAEHGDEIDAERAQQARQRAEKDLAEATDTMDRDRALAALHRAQARLQVSRKRRGSSGREGARID